MTLHIPLLGINPKELKIEVLHENMYTNYNSNILHNSQRVAATQLFVDRCTSMYGQNIVYLAIQRNEALKPITTRVNFLYIILSERSQSQKVAYCMIPFSI